MQRVPSEWCYSSHTGQVYSTLLNLFNKWVCCDDPPLRGRKHLRFEREGCHTCVVWNMLQPFLTDSCIKEWIWQSRAQHSLWSCEFLQLTYPGSALMGYVQLRKPPGAPSQTQWCLWCHSALWTTFYVWLDESHQNICWLYWLNLYWPSIDQILPEIDICVRDTEC